MTLSQTRPLTRGLTLAALAFAGTIASFGVTTAPVEAASSHYYRAQLATPVSEATSDIQRGTRWVCEGDTCVAKAQARSRDMHVCKRLEAKFGSLTAFRAGDTQFDAATLGECNS